MANAAARAVETSKPEPDWSKPVPMRWWRLPEGEHIGANRTYPIVSVWPTASRVDDDFGISGVVESITHLPNGSIAVGVLCGVSALSKGEVKYMLLRNGHGSVL